MFVPHASSMVNSTVSLTKDAKPRGHIRICKNASLASTPAIPRRQVVP